MSCVHRACLISHIPEHQTADASGTSTPAGGPSAAIASEDLDFSDMKKKKKTSKKKAMEDFEKELEESKSKEAAEGADEVEIDDGEHLNDIDEAELGDDPFARPEVPTGVDSGSEPWLTSDRDYTYQEVSSPRFNPRLTILTNPSSSHVSIFPFTPPILPFLLPQESGTPLLHLKSSEKVSAALSSPTSQISASACTDLQNTSFHSSLLRWVRREASTARGDWSSKVASNQNK